MSSVFAVDPSSKSFEEFARGRRSRAALQKGKDPDEAEARYQIERAERERMAPILAEEAALRLLRPRATREDRHFGRVYDTHYRETIDAMPVEPEGPVLVQDIIGQVARWATWKFGDLGRDDLRQEIELEALLLERDPRPEAARNSDGTWTHPGYITTCLKNHVRDYVRPELDWKKLKVSLTDVYEEPTEDFHADVELDVESFTRETLKEGLVLVVLNPSDLPAPLRHRLAGIRERLTTAEHRSLLHYAVVRYFRDHRLDSRASVSASTQRTLHRIISKYLPVVNELK